MFLKALQLSCFQFNNEDILFCCRMMSICKMFRKIYFLKDCQTKCYLLSNIYSFHSMKKIIYEKKHRLRKSLSYSLFCCSLALWKIRNFEGIYSNRGRSTPHADNNFTDLNMILDLFKLKRIIYSISCTENKL